LLIFFISSNSLIILMALYSYAREADREEKNSHAQDSHDGGDPFRVVA
jgi:hypothetical protein